MAIQSKKVHVWELCSKEANNSSSARQQFDDNAKAQDYLAPRKRQVAIEVICAQNLRRGKFLGKIKPYIVAWIYPESKIHIDGHIEAGRNPKYPKWNERLTFLVEEKLMEEPTSAITIEIRSHGSCYGGDSLVGTVRVLLSHFLDFDSNADGKMKRLAFQVRRPSGQPKGILNVGILPVIVPRGVNGFHGQDFGVEYV